MRRFNGDHAARTREERQPRGEINHIRHMRQHVIGNHQIRMAAPRYDIACRRAAKETHFGRHAGGYSARRDIRGWLHAKAWDTGGDKIAQQIAIIARDFDNEALRAQCKPLTHRRSVTRGVIKPALRK